MVGDWKLEMMAHKILEGIWKNRKQAVLDAYQMVSENIRSDKADNRAVISALDGKISRLNAKIEGFITMRAEGELSKEEYGAVKTKADEEMKALLAERDTLKNPVAESDDKPDMEAVRRALNEYIDFSQPIIKREIINKFVDKVTAQDNRRFQWDMNFTFGGVSPVYATVDGRKTNPTVTVEEDEGDPPSPPGTYINVHEHIRLYSQNTALGGEPPKRRSKVWTQNKNITTNTNGFI